MLIIISPCIGRLCRNSGEHFTSFRDGISEKAAQRHQERNKGDQTEEVSTAMHVSKFQESYFFDFWVARSVSTQKETEFVAALESSDNETTGIACWITQLIL